MKIMITHTDKVSHSLKLDEHLQVLIEIDESEELFFSFFLDLTQKETVEQQVRQLCTAMKPGLSRESLVAMDHARQSLMNIVQNQVTPEVKGLAYHHRDGSPATGTAISFHVPITPWATASHSPNIVPLVELRDSYDRYVVLISTDEQARILEIVLGTVTRQAWLTRPELRKRVGREWTREHYHNHRKDKARNFINEKIEIIQDLFRKNGYSHLILAGNPKRIAQIENLLPANLQEALLKGNNIDVNDPIEVIVQETIDTFVEQEAKDSKVTLNKLKSALLNGSGAVVGVHACEEVIQADVVDTLLITRSESSNSHRSMIKPFRHKSMGGNYMTIEKHRERILASAVANEIPIEFVDRGSFLDDYHGIGALLRYRGAEHVTDKNPATFSIKKAS